GKKMAKKKTHRTWGRIEQLPSGNFRAKFKHGGILHKAPSTFKEKASAEAWLNRNKAEIDKAEALGYKWVSPAERENQDQLSSTTVKTSLKHGLPTKKHYRSYPPGRATAVTSTRACCVKVSRGSIRLPTSDLQLLT